MSLRFEVLGCGSLAGLIDEIARLRITVFADWPYLYEGSKEYEARYLRTYLDSRDGIVVGAWDGNELVGAATGTPMEDHADEFGKALAGHGMPPGDVFYCAESVLLPQYRGQGAGHRFFELREARARELGRRWSMFCSVIRPADHPMRPEDYRPLDAFWRKRGYEKLEDAVAEFSWQDRGDTKETVKPMQVWRRDLDKAE